MWNVCSCVSCQCNMFHWLKCFYMFCCKLPDLIPISTISVAIRIKKVSVIKIQNNYFTWLTRVLWNVSLSYFLSAKSFLLRTLVDQFLQFAFALDINSTGYRSKRINSEPPDKKNNFPVLTVSISSLKYSFRAVLHCNHLR